MLRQAVQDRERALNKPVKTVRDIKVKDHEALYRSGFQAPVAQPGSAFAKSDALVALQKGVGRGFKPRPGLHVTAIGCRKIQIACE